MIDRAEMLRRHLALNAVYVADSSTRIGVPAAPPPPQPAPCRRLGDPTGDTVTCPTCCGERTQLKLYICDVYGVCTIDPARAVEGVACCRPQCPGYAPRANPAKVAE